MRRVPDPGGDGGQAVDVEGWSIGFTVVEELVGHRDHVRSTGACGWRRGSRPGLDRGSRRELAIDHVDLLVPRGSAFGYLGPNGAGKTTLIRTLLGLTNVDSGSMTLLGIPVPSRRSSALARVEPLCRRTEVPPSHGQGEPPRAVRRPGEGFFREDRAVSRTGGVDHRADQRVGTYSMGMRQRLGVAACLLADPELLILDEPMNGLDPAGMQDMRSMILTLVGEGRTVMLSSHLLDEVERTCDTVAVVDRGEIIRQGPLRGLVGGTRRP